jgi:hypothetical protein
VSDAPSTGEHSGGEPDPIESDPFEPAAGHLGAAPPPGWAQSSIPTPPPNWDAPSAESPPASAPTATPQGDASPAKHSLWVPPAGREPPPSLGLPAGGAPAGGGASGGGGSSTPWYTEPPAPYGGPSGRPYGSAAGPPYARRRAYPRGGAPVWARRRPPNPKTNIVWLVICLVSLGLLLPVPAIICWVRAFRYRSPRISQPPALVWLVWAVVFSVLSVAMYTTYIVLGATSNNGSPSSSTYVPPKTTTVAFGSTAHIVADVGGAKDLSPVPVAITLSDLVHRPHSGVRDVNLTTTIRVCATTSEVDPIQVGVGVNLVPVGGQQIFPSVDWPMFPEAFDGTPLAPHHCADGTLGYQLPTGARAQSFTYQDPRNNATWRIR